MKGKKIQKTFIVGDEWLYYKIYCGVKTADTILLDVIKPLTENLIDQKQIDKWFFIRYSDPDPHLRIRFHIIDISDLGNILINIHKLLKPFIESDQIWDIQLATYKRETERYGKNSIEIAESFFYFDSKQILSIIENSEDDEKRFLSIFLWIENLISLFDIEGEKRLSFLDRNQEQFKKEFKVDKIVRKELSDKYRKLEKHLFKEPKLKKTTKVYLIETVERFLILENENKLEVTLDYLLASLIHMTINRCFRSKQRLFEMMLYDFLYRKNKSKFVRYGRL